MIDGSGAQLVVPRFVAIDLAEPVRGAVPDSHVVASDRPMSTAVPDSWGTCRAPPPTGRPSGRAVVRHGLTEQLLLVRAGPPAAVDEERDPAPSASVAAWRRARSRAGSSLDTAGYSLSKTVTPSGTTPSDVPWRRRVAAGDPPPAGMGRQARPALHVAHSRGGRSAMRRSKTTTPAGTGPPLRTTPRPMPRPTVGDRRGKRRLRWPDDDEQAAARIVGARRVAVRCGSRSVMPPVKGPRRCRT